MHKVIMAQTEGSESERSAISIAANLAQSFRAEVTRKAPSSVLVFHPGRPAEAIFDGDPSSAKTLAGV